MVSPFRAVVLGCTLLCAGLVSEGQTTGSFPDWSSASTNSPANVSAGRASQAIKLGAGDLLEVSVYNVPELTTKVRIGSNGDVYLPLIDYVHISDLSVEEAQSLIGKRLSDGGFVKDPHVTIFVDEYNSQGAAILGEVLRPGTYPVLGPRKLFDLISAAGGLTDKAGGGVTVTHRDGHSNPATLPITQDLSANSESNISILPGDTIVVRRADIVYVVGDVNHPSGFMMNTGRLTVLQAIALAGGTTRTSKLNAVKIIRKTPNGVQQTDVYLKKMLQAKAPDLEMRADDILFVPSSAAKIATSRVADTAMGLVSALTIVAARP